MVSERGGVSREKTLFSTEIKSTVGSPSKKEEGTWLYNGEKRLKEETELATFFTCFGHRPRGEQVKEKT